MKLKEIISLLQATVDEGKKNLIGNSGNALQHLSKSEAYRAYGRANVDRWLLEGLIKLHNKKLNRSVLEAIAASSNRRTYLPVAERS